MAGILDTSTLTQVGFIVRDLEASKKKFAEFLGCPVPPTCDGGQYEVTGTTVEGQPAPQANCLMAFFDVGEHIQIELIQPNGVKSTWQDFLDEHGEGIHHLAFNVKNTDEKIRAMEHFAGAKVMQRGKYGNGKGEYTYLDVHDHLKCMIELLENY